MVTNSSNYMKDYYKKNPDKYNAHKTQIIDYRKTHKLTKERNRSNWMKCYFSLKNKIFILLGNKCVNPYNLPHPNWCNDPRCLQIDHVNGRGNKEKKTFKCYYNYLKYILKQVQNGSKDYQLLCANCNWIKRYENNELLNHQKP